MKNQKMVEWYWINIHLEREKKTWYGRKSEERKVVSLEHPNLGKMVPETEEEDRFWNQAGRWWHMAQVL